MRRVGFIGLGIMGQPMAANLVKAGFPVTVFDRIRAKCESLLTLGAFPSESPRDLALQSEVLITMLPDTPDVESALFGKGGVNGGLKKGMIIIDMGTISPSSSIRFAHRLDDKGCEMLDAPVSGGEQGAREGTLAIMVGGRREVFEKCLPIFQVLGKTITHTGPIGTGQKTKLVNQVIGALNVLAMVEGLRLAHAAGLDLKATLRTASGGAASSWMLANLGPKILNEDFAPGFSIRLEQKDLGLAVELTAELGGDFPGLLLVHSLFTRAMNKGLGEQGNQGLINLWSQSWKKS